MTILVFALSMSCRFLEYGEYKGNRYGTSREAVRDVLNSGKICVIDIEPNVRGGHTVLEFKKL